MTPRVWVFTQMNTDTLLLPIIGETIVDDNDTPLDPMDDISTDVRRIYQTTSLDKAPHDKPFIMYRQTSDVDSFRGDDGDRTRACGFMIFCHDIPGDYMRIDTILDHLKRLFKDTNDAVNNIVRSRWVESSEDWRDEDMGTIMKWARIQVIYKP